MAAVDLKCTMSLTTLMANERIARLVGHAFGDGYIHTTKLYLIYTNSSSSLLEHIRTVVSEEFGDVTVCPRRSGKGVPQLQFSANVGRALHSFGAPKGSKVHQQYSIPNWIRNGTREIKASFLSAIFDDEGYFREERDQMQIVLKQAKIARLEESLHRYLQGIARLLQDLGIQTSDVKRDQTKKRFNDETTISKRIWITGRTNFRQFREQIPIKHPDKCIKLTSMCT